MRANQCNCCPDCLTAVLTNFEETPMKKYAVLLAALLAVFLTACDKKKEEATSEAAAPAGEASSAPAGKDASAPASSGQ